ncbi:MAG: anthranilate synthase component I family protein [Bacteroidota bacterium]|nr:anthranilate synthase component I family protein [Bacteroidota bacterium]MDP4249278.1 anthranilate synthase component I family protein [Bacteroidota bacterium]
MKKIQLKTTVKKILSDIYTPVGIYLRLRDRFRDTVLLESTDYHAADNSYSFICIHAIGGIEISNNRNMEFKYPGRPTEKIGLNGARVPDLLWDYMQKFEVETAVEKPVKTAQSLFGYTTFDAVRFFDKINLPETEEENIIPLMRYRLYQYVIAINHFKDELYICENQVADMESELPLVESLIRSRDVPVYPFRVTGEETSNLTDREYMNMVEKGIKSCLRGDVFQIVLSRRYRLPFIGDEFNVYRALRNVNPSPYLFYFDYGDYRLMGSSPESQVLIKDGKAIMHPIAGTCMRSGNDEVDKAMAGALLKDAKENAEHVMLVDLARNDLSRKCDEVSVTHFREIQYYSHVIHLVSEVKGNLGKDKNPFGLLAATFPAGTLSGAPKIRAMELIADYEPTARSYYGGCIGFIGFDGTCTQAIMIRSLLSKGNNLTYQAGAGIVAASKPKNELEEVNHKLGALKRAIQLAGNI